MLGQLIKCKTGSIRERDTLPLKSRSFFGPAFVMGSPQRSPRKSGVFPATCDSRRSPVWTTDRWRDRDKLQTRPRSPVLRGRTGRRLWTLSQLGHQLGLNHVGVTIAPMASAMRRVPSVLPALIC
jgi:hypothetical protein